MSGRPVVRLIVDYLADCLVSQTCMSLSQPPLNGSDIFVRFIPLRCLGKILACTFLRETFNSETFEACGRISKPGKWRISYSHLGMLVWSLFSQGTGSCFHVTQLWSIRRISRWRDWLNGLEIWNLLQFFFSRIKTVLKPTFRVRLHGKFTI